MDADPVRHGRHGSEGPARSTASLVPDLLQSGTVRPLGPGVEAGGDVLGVSQELLLGQPVVREVGVRVDSASDGTEIVVTDTGVETGEKIYLIFSLPSTVLLSPSSPGRVCLVEPLYEVVREDVVVMLSLHHEAGGQHHQHQG